MSHQVQFIQLSQDEYDNLSIKKEGSLYFTTDTHRIYKGETLYASTTFDQLKFDDLSATSIKVDGVDVSLEGHTHTKDDIDDFPENVSDFTNDAGYLTEDDIQDINFENLNATSLKVDNKNVSLEGHTHTKSEITDFPTDVSSFTNDVGYLTETDLQDIEFGELEAESLKVDGKDVSVEGHTHTKDDIEDFPTNVSSFTNDAGYITQSDVDLTSITEKIPAAASSSNQLADKKFVTDSISTNSATFRGTFDSVSKLPTSGIDNNDYAIVKTETDVNNQTYTRYKYDGSKWVEEFTLNNTPFNSEQWAAINSGITSTTLDDYVKTSELENVNFENLKATSLTVDGKQVSLEDHTHSKDDITDFPTNVGDFENDVGYITIDDVDLSECSKVGHTHTKTDIVDFTHNHYKSEIVDFDHIHSKQDIVDFEHNHKMNEITGLIEELDLIKFNEEEIFITEED